MGRTRHPQTHLYIVSVLIKHHTGGVSPAHVPPKPPVSSEHLSQAGACRVLAALRPRVRMTDLLPPLHPLHQKHYYLPLSERKWRLRPTPPSLLSPLAPLPHWPTDPTS